MKRPSHMLRVVCGSPQKQPKGKNTPGMQERKVVKSALLCAAHASGSERMECVESSVGDSC